VVAGMKVDSVTLDDIRAARQRIETVAFRTPLVRLNANEAPAEIGIGGKSILPQMWPLVRRLLDGSIVVSLAEVSAAIRLLVERNRVIAEGAGAASVAAAFGGKAGSGKIACVVSGGNIDAQELIAILDGRLP
jgi:threonine dehydratase